MDISGKIACANVLSDLYAMGVTDCDNMLMLLAVSTKMTEKERDVVVPLLMRGFKVRCIRYIQFLVICTCINMCVYERKIRGVKGKTLTEK